LLYCGLGQVNGGPASRLATRIDPTGRRADAIPRVRIESSGRVHRHRAQVALFAVDPRRDRFA